MSIKEFMTKIYEVLQQSGNEEYSFTTNEIIKANDVVYYALTVTKRGENIGKNIYLEYYYEKFMNGYELDLIIKEITEELGKNREFIENNDCDNIIKNIMNYEAICEKIIFKLVNKERNNQFLQGKVYREFLDLALVYQVAVNNPEEGLAVCCIHPKMLKYWNVTEEQLYIQAMKNIQSTLPVRVKTLKDIISGMLEDLEEEFGEEINTPFYVLSNKYGVNGAATILYDNVLKDFANSHKVDRVIIIPSSVEEVLLIPMTSNDKVSEQEYNRILLEVNEQLEKHLWLSDHIYIYDCTEDVIEVWTE